jgi:molybdate transport system substrate-binding protein
MLLAGLAGCRSQPPEAPPPVTGPVTVLAASSTSDALEDVAEAFEVQTGIQVRISSGPSNALARQIITGVPADVFVSANDRWAGSVRSEGLADKLEPILANRLVLIVPQGNPASIQQPRDVLRDGVDRIALADENVPAGLYAEAALRELQVFDRFVEAGQIVRGHDVRVTLGYVERAEVAAGIVYATDARLTKRVDVVFTFPAEVHEPIEYPAILLKNRPNREGGSRFFEYLRSDQAQRIFERHGFLMPDADATADMPTE